MKTDTLILKFILVFDLGQKSKVSFENMIRLVSS